MSRVELVRPTGLDPSVPYAYASVVGPGSLVFTAGACPLDDAGEVVHPGDVAGQAETDEHADDRGLRAPGRRP